MPTEPAPPVALAVGAHPDDIEFTMAGTLLLLKEAGCEIHMWNLANGAYGSAEMGAAATAARRLDEAREAAAVAGAHYHPPLFEDLHVFYDAIALARVGAVVRDINPGIVLTHPRTDYMEDHEITCRLITSALFARAMPNFQTNPKRPASKGDTALYHALPHGMETPVRETVLPEFVVNIESKMRVKREMLACHRSQKEWLDRTQGMDAYLDEMETQCKAVAQRLGPFTHAEGWTRHSHLGFAARDHDPLRELIRSHCSPSEAG